MRKSGKVVLHQEITTEFPKFLKAIKPYLYDRERLSSRYIWAIGRFGSAVLSIDKNIYHYSF
jgi:hypothetical protein